jgi:hypothetical protein
MPFTLAHPAAVIPLHRRLGRAGILSALIIGSMAPDMAYFVPLGIDRTATHSLAGLLWFCVPVGLVSYVLFHALLRPLGHYLLPVPVQSRLPPASGPSWIPTAPLWAVGLSLVLGAATHLLWDAFMHGDGFVVQTVPALQSLLCDIGGYRVTVYKGFQHGSSLLGLLLLARWVMQWFRATQPHHTPHGWRPPAAARAPALLILLAAPALAGLISGVWHTGDATGMRALQQFTGHGVITAISVFGTIFLGFGVIWRLWEAWERQRPHLPQAPGGYAG